MIPNKLDDVWFLDSKGDVQTGTVFGVSEVLGSCTIHCLALGKYEHPTFDNIFATKEEAEKAKFLADLKQPPAPAIKYQGWNDW